MKNGYNNNTYDLCTEAQINLGWWNEHELNSFESQFPPCSDGDNNTQLCPAVGRAFANKDLAVVALPFSFATAWEIITVGITVCRGEVSIHSRCYICISIPGFLSSLLLLTPFLSSSTVDLCERGTAGKEPWGPGAPGQASWSSRTGCSHALRWELKPQISRPGCKTTF